MSTSLETASSNNNNNKQAPTTQSPQPNIVILDSQIMDSQDVQAAAGLASLSNHNSMKFIREGAIQYHTQNHIQSPSIGQPSDNKVHVISNVTLLSKQHHQAQQVQYLDTSKMTSKLITMKQTGNSGANKARGINTAEFVGKNFFTDGKHFYTEESYSMVQSSSTASPSSSSQSSSPTTQISSSHLLQKMSVPRNIQVVTRIQASSSSSSLSSLSSSSSSGNNSNNIITYRATPDQQQQNTITFAGTTANESNILIPGSTVTTGKSSVLVNNNNNNNNNNSTKAINYKANNKQIGVKVVQNVQLQQAQPKSVNIKGLHSNLGPNSNGKMTSGKNNSTKYSNTSSVTYQQFTPQYAPTGKLVRSNSGSNVIKSNKNQVIQPTLYNNMLLTAGEMMAPQAIQYVPGGAASPISGSPHKFNEQYVSFASSSPSKSSTNVTSDATKGENLFNGQQMTDESSALILTGISQKMFNKINYTPPSQTSQTVQQLNNASEQNANSNSEQVTYIDNIPLPIKSERNLYTEHQPEEETVAIEMRPVPVDTSKGKLSHILQAILQDHTYFAKSPESEPQNSTTTVSGTLSSEETVQTHLQTQLSQTNLSKLNSTSNLDYFNSNRQVEDDANSVISTGSRNGNHPDNDLGEETETAPEGEGEEDSVTRCICDFTHDDGYMISCDKCDVWQHVDCMGIDRLNIPAEYYCEECQPRSIDKNRARQIQMAKRKEQQLLFGVLPALPPIEGASPNFLGATLPVPLPTTNNKTAAGQLKPNKKQPKSVVSKKKSEQPSTYGTGAAKKAKREAAASRLNGKRKELKKNQSTASKKKLKNADLQNDEKAQQTVRGWIENYERAMTNHYAPELRARINAIGKHHPNQQMLSPVEEKLIPSALVHNLQQRCINIAMFGGQILISSNSIPEKMPIIEIRGRYMLAMQNKQLQMLYNPTIPNKDKICNKHAGLFLFLYNIPSHNLEICVDTRTYGNDARFVRRSCKPNAEIQHNIEKGVVHLYIVAKTNIAGNTEITIQHDDQLVEKSPEMLLSNTTPADYCACGVPRDCLYLQKYADLNKNQIIPIQPPPTAPPKPPKAKKNNGQLGDGEPKRQPKKRTSRSSTLEKRLRSISSSGGESTNELFLSPPPQQQQQHNLMNRLNLLIDSANSREIQFNNELMSPPPPQIMQSPVHVPPPSASPVKFLKSRQNSMTEDLELIHQQQQLHQQQIIEDVLKIQRVNTPLQSPIKQTEIITNTEAILSPRIITNYNIIEQPQQQQPPLHHQHQQHHLQSVLLSPTPISIPEVVNSEPNLTPVHQPQIEQPNFEPYVENPVVLVNKEIEIPQLVEQLPIIEHQPPPQFIDQEHEQLQMNTSTGNEHYRPEIDLPHYVENNGNDSGEILAQTPEKTPTTPLTSPSSGRKKSKDHGTVSVVTPTEKDKNTKNSRKLTREERKMEAIVKAFEKMEQAQHRKQELKEQRTHGKRRSISSSNSLPSPDEGPLSNKKKLAQAHKRKKKKTKLIAHMTAAMNTQQKKKRPINKKKTNLENINIQQHIDMARALPSLQPTESKAAELLLTFSQSPYDRNGNSNDHPPIIQHSNSVITTAPASTIQHTTNPSSLPLLSSACMLIEAAVGPLEQATNNNSEILQSFKMPQKAKTKKSIMNDWLHQAAENAVLPQPVQKTYTSEQDSGYISEADYMKYQKTDENKMCIVAKKVEEFIMQNSPQPDDPTFIKWEETKNIPATQHLTNFNNTAESCVKKRWLRQAISEETTSDELVMTVSSSSPPPQNGFTTPLKKRRLVRENSNVENSSVIVSTNANYSLNDMKEEVKEEEDEEKEALDLSISNDQMKVEKIEISEIKEEEKIQVKEEEKTEIKDEEKPEIKQEELEQSQYPRITRSKGSQKYIASPSANDLDTSDALEKSSESSGCSPKSNFETPEKSKSTEYEETVKEDDVIIAAIEEDQQVPILKTEELAIENEELVDECVDNEEVAEENQSMEEEIEAYKEVDSEQQTDQVDDKDDIENLQKVIATFHTENIMNLISRNRMKKKNATSLSRENSDESIRASMKKAVKLTFDLSVEDDMVSVALKKPTTPPQNNECDEQQPQKIETIVDAVVPQNHYENECASQIVEQSKLNLNHTLPLPVMTVHLPTSYQSNAARNLLSTFTQDSPTSNKSYSNFVPTSNFLKSNYLEGVYPSQPIASNLLTISSSLPSLVTNQSLSSLNTSFLKPTLSETLSTLGTPTMTTLGTPPLSTLGTSALLTLGTPPLSTLSTSALSTLGNLPLSTLGTAALSTLGTLPMSTLGTPLSTLGTLPMSTLGTPLSTLGASTLATPLSTLGTQPLSTLGTSPLSTLGTSPLSTLGTPTLSTLGTAPLSTLGAATLSTLGAQPLSTLGTQPLQLSTPTTLTYPKIFTKTASSDPRLNPALTVPAPPAPPATPKRKLSINEYRKRKQQCETSTPTTPTTTANLESPKICESNQNNEESIVSTILSATEKILSEPPTSVDEIENSLLEKNNNTESMSSAMIETENNVTITETLTLSEIKCDDASDGLK